ncbi:MAG: autotransporter-associated beta strand repeat-containing protein, partial [Thermoguttaceae bacterium]|nr:autotransporter-associated beta strand repeat-containing protein [Thermoguttaceae bacterium]
MSKNRIKTLVPVFSLLLTVLCAYETTQAAPLELSSGDYTTATLNDALNGYDSVNVSTGTVNFTLNGTKIGTNSITVSSGTLNWNANSPNGNDYIFDGEITVKPGAELYLNGADPLGNSSSDTGSWRTLNIGGTLRLSSGSNKTMRRVTLNLTGGTVTGHEWQYRSNASVLQATSGNSKFESSLYFRSDATTPKITVSSGATLTMSGMRKEGTISNMTFNGGGTTILSKQIGRLTSTINVTESSTLRLGIGDTLGASGNAITLNIGEGSALDMDAASAGGVTNQTGRDMTINLTGATMKNGRLHFFSPSANPTVINILASSKTTEIASTLQLRTQSGNQEDHLINVENGEAAVDLLLSGTLESYNAKQYLTLTGGGTTKLAGNVASNVTRVTLDSSTLQLGKNNPMTNATTLQTNGTFDLNGYSTTVGLLTGSGSVTNIAEGASVLTIETSQSDHFYGTVTGNVNFVKTGTGTWTVSSDNDWSSSSLEIQNGTVALDKARTSGNGRRLLTGKITIGENGKLSLKANDALGNVGGGGSWANNGLDVDILGTLEVTASGNQTSRYINYNLYGGTINITNGGGKILTMESITTINSRAKYGTEDVTETSVINGWLAARDGSRMVTLNVEDGLPDTDLHWTGFLKHENGSYAANLTKTGAGTLRLTSASGTTFSLKDGMTVSDGRIILDGAAVTGADVTVADGATFAAVNGSSISNNLVMNGNYELALADIAASDAPIQLSIDGNLLFGQDATASINANGDVNWYALNGKTLMS